MLLAHALLGIAVIAGGARLGRRAFWVVLPVHLATLVWAAAEAPAVLDGRPRTSHATWVAGAGLSIDLRLDGLGLVFIALISGVGALVCVYATRYFRADTPGLHSMAGLLTVFAGAMLGVVWADNLLLLAVAWELTSVTSFLLIGGDGRSATARAAATRALLVTGSGGLAMLAGFILIGQEAGTFRLSDVLADPPRGTTVAVALVLVLVGAMTKSAQQPFSGWLPGAMVAPTPVSAYLHSATMVKAGVYLIARFAPAFAEVGTWRPLVLATGSVTMVVGALRALRQHDLKVLLAFGTVSQLGLMVVLFGLGTPEATTAGVVLLLAHGLFKAALFLVTGIIDHQAGTRDLRRLGLRGPDWRVLAVLAGLAAASMAGIVPLLGFVAKEAAFEGLAHTGLRGTWVVLAVVVGGSMLTMAYSARFWFGAFDPRYSRGEEVEEGRVSDPAAPSGPFLAPVVLLGALTLVLGLAPGTLDRLVGAAATSLDPEVHDVHLALWHGLTLPLALSGLVIAGGAAIVLARHPVASGLARVPGLAGVDLYRSVVRSLQATSRQVTRLSQPGSLPVYVGVIMLTAVVVPGVALLSHPAEVDLPDVISQPIEVAVAALIVGGAVAAALSRRRIVAVLCLGSVGYGMGGFFVLSGAPDLALTQFAVETLATVLFVLVLRSLPDRFQRPRVGRTARLAVSLLAGSFVLAFALVASSARVTAPVSSAYLERALPEGGGNNVVNVILVDFRGYDTLGEITVLVVAALGVVGLARIGRTPVTRRGRGLVDGEDGS